MPGKSLPEMGIFSGDPHFPHHWTLCWARLPHYIYALYRVNLCLPLSLTVFQPKKLRIFQSYG